MYNLIIYTYHICIKLKEIRIIQSEKLLRTNISYNYFPSFLELISEYEHLPHVFLSLWPAKKYPVPHLGQNLFFLSTLFPSTL